MERKITPEEREKRLKELKYSYEMYEDTIKSTEKRMKTATAENGVKKYTQENIDEEMALLREAQGEIISKYTMFGGKESDLVKKKATKKKAGVVAEEKDLYQEAAAILKEKEEKKEAMPSPTETVVTEREYLPNETQSFDVIPLPSNGQCYKQKIARLPVAYLTAYDENMIIAPNLYRDNKIIDLMLQNKILNRTIDPNDLLEGDRDAIILFLRANGYGNEYPITATDSATGKEFDAVIDLSTLKYKEFKLTGDENGWFDFELPVSKKKVKFKFLTHRDNLILKTLEEKEDKKLLKGRLEGTISLLDGFIEGEDEMDKALKTRVRQSIRTIEEWKESLSEDELGFNHSVTNKMELAIMAVDDITDRKYIRNFVRNMNVKDSSALRRYITENEPGIDFNIKVDKPESLGGGSMTVFLQLDQYVFLNIA